MIQPSLTDIAATVADRKKQKFPAGRSLFALVLVIALGVLSWLNWVGVSAVILTCFIYLIYVHTETTEEIFDQLTMLRFENATLRQQVDALAEVLAQARLEDK